MLFNFFISIMSSYYMYHVRLLYVLSIFKFSISIMSGYYMYLVRLLYISCKVTTSSLTFQLFFLYYYSRILLISY